MAWAVDEALGITAGFLTGDTVKHSDGWQSTRHDDGSLDHPPWQAAAQQMQDRFGNPLERPLALPPYGRCRRQKPTLLRIAEIASNAAITYFARDLDR